MTKPLLDICRGLLPGVTFVPGKTFYWSPSTYSIHFDPKGLEDEAGQWALLHEVAHAQLNHTSYNNDAALLKLEVDAWQAALKTAQKLSVTIDDAHVQDCLDTYRHWLYARSSCPACTLNSLQVSETTYRCLNCTASWSVSRSRFCRPYRMKLALNQ